MTAPQPEAPATRDGEIGIVVPPATDAGLVFIGAVRTPWRSRRDCPRRGDPVNGPDCRLEIDTLWRPALEGLAAGDRIDVLYWMHEARRDLLLQNPKSRGVLFGTFALRSPVRPNPIAVSAVLLVAVLPDALVVRGLDCLDGTPLLDIKPINCPAWPAPGE